MQLSPHPALAHLVRHYLVLEGPLPSQRSHRLFTDGNTGLVFNLGHAALTAAGSAETCAGSWLYGQVSTYHDFTLSGNLHWIVVVLQPYAAAHLWGTPATEWGNRFLPATEVRGLHTDDITTALLQAPNMQARVRLLDNYLLQLADQRPAPDAMMMQAVQKISATEGALPIPDLLKTLSVGERTLERKFKLYTGISPKHFSGIVRLNASAKRLQRLQPGVPLTGIAYESGYFDQAHFIHAFKQYTGITPQQYQQNARPLALNFLQL